MTCRCCPTKTVQKTTIAEVGGKPPGRDVAVGSNVGPWCSCEAARPAVQQHGIPEFVHERGLEEHQGDFRARRVDQSNGFKAEEDSTKQSVGPGSWIDLPLLISAPVRVC